MVGLRVVALTPDLEQGDHLRHRQISAWLLIVSSLLAIAVSFIDRRVALWALALELCGAGDPGVEQMGAGAGLN
jgi:hypothetical protein